MKGHDAVRIEFIGDINSLLCYIAYRRIKRACSLLLDFASWEVVWVPLVPDAVLPGHGTSKRAHLRSRLGAAGLEHLVQDAAEAFAEEGLELDLDGPVADTTDAQRLLAWAGREHGRQAQDALAEGVCSRYWCQGQAIGGTPEGRSALCEAAVAAGLPRDQAAAVLADPQCYLEEVQHGLAANRDVRSTPCCRIGRLLVTGCKTVNEYYGTLRAALEDVLTNRMLQLDVGRLVEVGLESPTAAAVASPRCAYDLQSDSPREQHFDDCDGEQPQPQRQPQPQPRHSRVLDARDARGCTSDIELPQLLRTALPPRSRDCDPADGAPSALPGRLNAYHRAALAHGSASPARAASPTPPWGPPALREGSRFSSPARPPLSRCAPSPHPPGEGSPLMGSRHSRARLHTGASISVRELRSYGSYAGVGGEEGCGGLAAGSLDQQRLLASDCPLRTDSGVLTRPLQLLQQQGYGRPMGRLSGCGSGGSSPLRTRGPCSTTNSPQRLLPSGAAVVSSSYERYTLASNLELLKHSTVLRSSSANSLMRRSSFGSGNMAHQLPSALGPAREPGAHPPTQPHSHSHSYSHAHGHGHTHTQLHPTPHPHQPLHAPHPPHPAHPPPPGPHPDSPQLLGQQQQQQGSSPGMLPRLMTLLRK